MTTIDLRTGRLMDMPTEQHPDDVEIEFAWSALFTALTLLAAASTKTRFASVQLRDENKRAWGAQALMRHADRMLNLSRAAMPPVQPAQVPPAYVHTTTKRR